MPRSNRIPLIVFCLLSVTTLAVWFFRSNGGVEETSVSPTPPPSSPPESAPSTPRPPTRDDVVLAADLRALPGKTVTPWLFYRDDKATTLHVGGTWSAWDKKHPMQKVAPGIWAFALGDLKAPFGRHEFKFIVDGVWEGGDNRLLHLNDNGLLYLPPDIVAESWIEGPNDLRIVFKRLPADHENLPILLEPSHGTPDLRWRIPKSDPRTNGFALDGDTVNFVFDPAIYGRNPSRVHVAGTFNGWNANANALLRSPDGLWRAALPFADVRRGAKDGAIMFKFVADGDQWLTPPENATNAAPEPGTPHMNLHIDEQGAVRPELWVKLSRPIELNAPPVVLLQVNGEKIRLRPTPGRILETLRSPKQMGVTLDRANNRTIYRLFAPRAVQVTLGLFDTPHFSEGVDDARRILPPRERVTMVRDADGVWEATRPGLNLGQYYSFNLLGPLGDAEGFNENAWVADPNALAMAHAEGNSIVVDPAAPSPFFKGWEPELHRHRRPREDLVIYETHVRHLTKDASSGVVADLRGSYLGLLASDGTGTGLDHLRDLGVNVIQFMPVQEFTNGPTAHDWGYGPSFYFAPEASYAQKPLEASQVFEFKHLVNELQKKGFAVYIDVVYNHLGGVNVFHLIDRKYYFRLNPDLTNQNWSGCGNDFATERPMARRLIVDSVLHWVEEYGIDGFRFDLAELVDMQTLLEIQEEIRKKHPHVVLISEPWSFRGSHKDKLAGTDWAAWNDQFREPGKRFITGRGDRENLKAALRGSVERWTSHPLQSVIYLESHDDHALADELTLNPGHDGRQLTSRDEKIHKLGATLIFTSLGMPMIAEGQEFLRSKHGVKNTYNRGDELNALRWGDRERPIAREVLATYRDMIALRLSDAGRAFRVATKPSDAYIRFVEPAELNALGWIVNASGERDVPAWLVLMNAAETPVEFEVDLPPGLWRQTGDGATIAVDGLPGKASVAGGRILKLQVPPQTAYLYRNGFTQP